MAPTSQTITVPESSTGKVLRDDMTWATIFDGLSKITVGLTAPESPSVGDLWVDTT